MCPDRAKPSRELDVLLLRQHGRIRRLLHDAQQLVGNSAGGSELPGLVKELCECFEAHFDTEEALMREHGYTDSVRHAAEHGLLRAKLDSALVERRREPTANTIHELERWFESHEATFDSDLMSFLEQSRVQAGSR
jgi:hemerythrin